MASTDSCQGFAGIRRALVQTVKYSICVRVGCSTTSATNKVWPSTLVVAVWHAVAITVQIESAAATDTCPGLAWVVRALVKTVRCSITIRVNVGCATAAPARMCLQIHGTKIATGRTERLVGAGWISTAKW